MTEDILFSTSVQKILKFLLSSPGARFYDREISRMSGVKKSSSNYALRKLKKAGIVFAERKGRIIFYRLDPADPLANQLRITLNLAIARPLTDCLKHKADRIILHGPAAAGANHAGDDIDIFVSGRDKPSLEKIIMESAADDSISCLVCTPSEYLLMENNNHRLFREISRGIKIL